jgi:hypothetical protein
MPTPAHAAVPELGVAALPNDLSERRDVMPLHGVTYVTPHVKTNHRYEARRACALHSTMEEAPLCLQRRGGERDYVESAGKDLHGGNGDVQDALPTSGGRLRAH